MRVWFDSIRRVLETPTGPLPGTAISSDDQKGLGPISSGDDADDRPFRATRSGGKMGGEEELFFKPETEIGVDEEEEDASESYDRHVVML
tara:strand:- start:225 stop:494 length:270 start_codon:yes stop_codon:yes gene_type:complete